MNAKLYKSFRFEAAHRLPRLPAEHPCSRVHGHSFAFELWLQGEVDPDKGWVLDLGDIGQVGKALAEQLDHRLLNDIEGLENPTCEMLAAWLWRRAKAELPGLCKVVVHETCTAGCEYSG